MPGLICGNGEGSVIRRVLLHSADVSPRNLESLATVFDDLIRIDSLVYDLPTLALLNRPELNVSFTKLHVWRLTQFDKIVFLDADVLVLRNIDELFEYDELSAAPDCGWPNIFNSGVFVAQPSIDTFTSLLAHLESRGSFDGGDQGLLNQYFSDWATTPSRHIPFTFNVTPTTVYSYAPAYRYFRQDVRVLHFIGSDKPWKWHRFSDGTMMQRPGANSDLLEMVSWWWSHLDSARSALHQQHKDLSTRWHLDQPAYKAPAAWKQHAESAPIEQEQQQQQQQHHTIPTPPPTSADASSATHWKQPHQHQEQHQPAYVPPQYIEPQFDFTPRLYNDPIPFSFAPPPPPSPPLPPQLQPQWQPEALSEHHHHHQPHEEHHEEHHAEHRQHQEHQSSELHQHHQEHHHEECQEPSHHAREQFQPEEAKQKEEQETMAAVQAPVDFASISHVYDRHVVNESNYNSLYSTPPPPVATQASIAKAASATVKPAPVKPLTVEVAAARPRKPATVTPPMVQSPLPTHVDELSATKYGWPDHELDYFEIRRSLPRSMSATWAKYSNEIDGASAAAFSPTAHSFHGELGGARGNQKVEEEEEEEPYRPPLKLKRSVSTVSLQTATMQALRGNFAASSMSAGRLSVGSDAASVTTATTGAAPATNAALVEGCGSTTVAPIEEEEDVCSDEDLAVTAEGEFTLTPDDMARREQREEAYQRRLTEQYRAVSARAQGGLSISVDPTPPSSPAPQQLKSPRTGWSTMPRSAMLPRRSPPLIKRSVSSLSLTGIGSGTGLGLGLELDEERPPDVSALMAFGVAGNFEEAIAHAVAENKHTQPSRAGTTASSSVDIRSQSVSADPMSLDDNDQDSGEWEQAVRAKSAYLDFLYDTERTWSAVVSNMTSGKVGGKESVRSGRPSSYARSDLGDYTRRTGDDDAESESDGGVQVDKDEDDDIRPPIRLKQSASAVSLASLVGSTATRSVASMSPRPSLGNVMAALTPPASPYGPSRGKQQTTESVSAPQSPLLRQRAKTFSAPASRPLRRVIESSGMPSAQQQQQQQQSLAGIKRVTSREYLPIPRAFRMIPAAADSDDDDDDDNNASKGRPALVEEDNKMATMSMVGQDAQGDGSDESDSDSDCGLVMKTQQPLPLSG
ncbi:glycogenin glucosyltransferase [Sorochytrium milnesiophthora]